MSEGDDADEIERRQAEALRRALAGEALDQSAPDLPADALGTAALLRHAGTGSALPEARADALLEGLLGDFERQHAPRRLRRLWPFAAGLAAAAALAMAFVALPARQAPQSAVASPAPQAAGAAPTALPLPSRELIASQAELVQPGASSERFDRAMRDYRGALLRALQNAYPAPLSLLEPARRQGRRP